MRLAQYGLGVVLLCLPVTAASQEGPGYSRLNTFSGFGEYSNDSSHIILGVSENRKIGAIGFQYERRLVHRRLLDFGYTAEIRPGMLESDPTETVTFVFLAPVASVNPGPSAAVVRCQAVTDPPVSSTLPGANGPVTYTEQTVVTCGRRTVVEQSFSPAGVRVNLMPGRRLQPTFSSFAGYIFSSQEVPIPDAGSFNFAFEFGAGLEFYQTRGRSVRLEYQVQHYSNKSTADLNPGVDSGIIKLTYSFGR
jgi:hypothetical protein